MKHQLRAVRSAKAAVVGALLISAPYLLLLSGRDLLGPLPALYGTLMTLFLLPVALCMVALICGVLPMAVGLGAALGVMAALTGAGKGTALLLAAVYVLPVLGAFLAVNYFEVPFKKSCPLMIGVHAATLAAVYAICQRMTGNDLYAVMGQSVSDFLEHWELGDLMLYELYSAGIIDVNDTLRESMVHSSLYSFSLSDAARADMLLSVRSMITQGMQGTVPQVIAGQSLLGGVMSLLLPLRFGFLAQEKRQFLQEGDSPDGPQAVDFSMLDMPPFQLWHLPRGKGWQVGAAMALGYILQLTRTPAGRIAGILLYTAASDLFLIQGAATLNFIQKRRGTRRVWRVVVPVLLSATPVLMLIGIFDQMNNARGLRKPPEPKEDF